MLLPIIIAARMNYYTSLMVNRYNYLLLLFHLSLLARVVVGMFVVRELHNLVLRVCRTKTNLAQCYYGYHPLKAKLSR